MIQKQKLAKKISHHLDFWKELKNINPIIKCTTEVMDQVNGNANITELLAKQILNIIYWYCSCLLDI